MAPSIPGCNGRVLVEGFAYKRRDPHRGEIVAIHASGASDGDVTPDEEARDVSVMSRVVALPGDVVVGRNGNAYVNDFKIDDIQTAPFPRVEVGPDRYFVLGDNRSDARDSGTSAPSRATRSSDVSYGCTGRSATPAPRSSAARTAPGPGLCD